MSRIACPVPGDEDCVAGYDVPLRTYFFVSGNEDKDGRPRTWLGKTPGELPKIRDLEEALRLAFADPFFDLDTAVREAILRSAGADIQQELASGRLDAKSAGALLDIAATP